MTGRNASIDLLRGITILTMIFVNEVAGLSGMPAWMLHYPMEEDGMTFVDVVFPSFLFIVGMAIPYAVGNRTAKGQDLIERWKHVLIRSFSLIIMGIFMVNMSMVHEESSGMSRGLWSSLVFVGFIITWNNYPSSKNSYRFKNLKWFGVVSLILLAVIFRKGSDGQLQYISHEWWGILGLIGWAYLGAIIWYLCFGKSLLYLMGGVLLSLAFYFLFHSFEDNHPSLSYLFTQRIHFTHIMIVLIGIISSKVAKEGTILNPTYSLVLVALLCLVGGAFLQPHFGISKIQATPSWGLYSALICIMLYILLDYLRRVPKASNYLGWIKPASKNPLLIYILPPIFYAFTGGFEWPPSLSAGFLGLSRVVVFTAVMLMLIPLLNRIGIRLKV